jgi:hypothetical protein
MRKEYLKITDEQAAEVEEAVSKKVLMCALEMVVDAYENTCESEWGGHFIGMTPEKWKERVDIEVKHWIRRAEDVISPLKIDEKE